MDRENLRPALRTHKRFSAGAKPWAIRQKPAALAKRATPPHRLTAQGYDTNDLVGRYFTEHPHASAALVALPKSLLGDFNWPSPVLVDLNGDDDLEIVAFAAKENTIADDGAGKHSPFTAALLKIGREPGVPIEQALKAVKVRPAHVEGYGRAEWVLLDYFDFIVHVFSPGARQFYGLERLWGDAKRIEVPAIG